MDSCPEKFGHGGEPQVGGNRCRWSHTEKKDEDRSHDGAASDAGHTNDETRDESGE